MLITYSVRDYNSRSVQVFFCLLQDKKSAVDSSEEITEAKG